MNRRALLLACAAVGIAGPARAALTRFSVKTTGTGPDLILIPGLMCSGAVWDTTAARLSARFRVHQLTLAGFAGVPAGPNASGPLIDPAVEDIAAFIREAGMKAPAIVGHSLGGLIGLILAAKYPDLAGRLMIVDALPFYALLYNPTATAEQMQPQAAAMRDSMTAMPKDAFAANQRDGVKTMTKAPADQERVAGWSIASDQGVGARAFYEDSITDARPYLPKIKARTTVLHAFDPAMQVPPYLIDRIYETAYLGVAGVTHKRVDGSYHFIMFDQPAAFAREVDAFLIR